MALNYAEALTMQRAAADTGRSLGIAYYRRMYPKVARAKHWFQPSDGFRAWIADPEKSGGGPLRDIASHRIHLMNYLFGQPVRVSGHLSTLVHSIQVEDNATVMIEYGSGVRGRRAVGR